MFYLEYEASYQGQNSASGIALGPGPEQRIVLPVSPLTTTMQPTEPPTMLGGWFPEPPAMLGSFFQPTEPPAMPRVFGPQQLPVVPVRAELPVVTVRAEVPAALPQQLSMARTAPSFSGASTAAQPGLIPKENPLQRQADIDMLWFRSQPLRGALEPLRQADQEGLLQGSHACIPPRAERCTCESR